MSVSQIIMLQEFLRQYPNAVDLDDSRFDTHFPEGIQRSDFLLFDRLTICEFKEIRNIDIRKRVEYLLGKHEGKRQGFKRDLYNSISLTLSKSNKQIRDTKIALGLPEALGLVILENMIPSDLSVVTLIDAADRKMLNGLDSVDAVLCADFVNIYSDADGNPSRPIQIVTRKTVQSKLLYHLVGRFIQDFCSINNTPITTGASIKKADQKWVVTNDGKYQKFVSTFEM